MLTRRFLKEKQLLAVPFDKGIGICIMPTATYNEKIKKVTDLPQFQKVEPTRKNAKNPISKEEERIISILKDMNKRQKISGDLMKKLQLSGSQPGTVVVRTRKNSQKQCPTSTSFVYAATYLWLNNHRVNNHQTRSGANN